MLCRNIREMINCERNNLLRLFLQAGASCSFLKEDAYSRRFRHGNKFGFIIEKVAERDMKHRAKRKQQFRIGSVVVASPTYKWTNSPLTLPPSPPLRKFKKLRNFGKTIIAVFYIATQFNLLSRYFRKAKLIVLSTSKLDNYSCA